MAERNASRAGLGFVASTKLGKNFWEDDHIRLSHEADVHGERKAGGFLTDLVDPGVGPILTEGPTPANVGLLALGVGSGFLGAPVRMGRQIVGKIDDVIRKADSKWKYMDPTPGWAEAGFVQDGVEDSLAKSMAKQGMKPEGLPDMRRIELTELDPDALVEVRKMAAAGDPSAQGFLDGYKKMLKGEDQYGWSPAFIDARVADDTLKVDLSALHPALRGKNVGTHAYMQLMVAAGAEGMKKFASDITVSADAQRVWESLAKRGVNVKVNPAAKRNPKTGGMVSSRPDEPVFSIDLDHMYDPDAYKAFEAAMYGKPSNVASMEAKRTSNFQKEFAGEVAERADETAQKVSSWSGWQFGEGARVKSNSSGKVWEITGMGWDKRKDEPFYFIKNAEGEATTAPANLAHKGFQLMGGPKGVK